MVRPACWQPAHKQPPSTVEHTVRFPATLDTGYITLAWFDIVPATIVPGRQPGTVELESRAFAEQEPIPNWNESGLPKARALSDRLVRRRVMRRETPRC
jgi:hypothetical protein